MTQGTLTRGLAAVALVLLAAACSDSREATSADLTAPDGPLFSTVPTQPSAYFGVAEHEYFEVCKQYAGAVGPAVTIDVSVDIGDDGSTDTTFPVTLADGDCTDVWLHGSSVYDLVTVTEQVPAGYEASYVRTTVTEPNSVFVTDPSVASNSASGSIRGNVGVLVVFTNTEMAGVGRMTGGGGQIRVDGARITRGFTIHCDIVLSNNLEVNWPGGNKWHITKPLMSASCIDDPAVDPVPPDAPFDTFVGVGSGKLNGAEGSIVKFTFVDAGEPGRNDMATIQIWAPGANPDMDSPMLDVSGYLDHGNLQAHRDQPHK